MNRNGIYYCRVPVPKYLQTPNGKKEIWKSLGIRSYSEAIQAVKTQVMLIMEELVNKSSPRPPKIEVGVLEGEKPLTEQVISTMAELRYNIILHQDELHREKVGSKLQNLNSCAKIISGIAQQVYKFDPKAERNEATQRILSVLEKCGAPVNKGTLLNIIRDGAELIKENSNT
ncbi:MAG: hypothetical protein P8P30_09240 [Rickettsiales bacterium]|nr:hypothetical protein [Rickettsiales bacterium]